MSTFSATFITPGTQTITATDINNNTLTDSATVSVVGSQATHFLVAGNPSTVAAGGSVVFTVQALDANNTLVSGYNGTVQFTTTDTLATVPPAYTFGTADGGVHVFSVTFKTAGIQTLTVADAVDGIYGTSNDIEVTSDVAPFVQSINRSTPGRPKHRRQYRHLHGHFQPDCGRRQCQRLSSGLDRHGHGHVDAR